MAYAIPNQDTSAVKTSTPIEQQSKQENANTDSSPLVQESKGGVQSLWKLVEYAGNIGIVIGLIFLVGIFFICLEFITRLIDKKRSAKMIGLKFKDIKLEHIKRAANDKSKTNIVSELISRLLLIYDETGSSITFNDEIAKYKQVLHERFDTFKNRMAFLSDTCGALG